MGSSRQGHCWPLRCLRQTQRTGCLLSCFCRNSRQKKVTLSTGDVSGNAAGSAPESVSLQADMAAQREITTSHPADAECVDAVMPPSGAATQLSCEARKPAALQLG